MVSARGSARGAGGGSLVGLTFDLEGEEILNRQLSRFGEGVEDFSPAWNKMRDEFYEIERDQFTSQGSHSGGWRALAPGTVRQKRGRSVIMVDTRRLFKSLTGPGGENIARITPDTFTFGSRVFYGVFHQSTRARTRLPRRALIALNSEDKRALTKIMQGYLAGLAAQARSTT